MKQLHHVNQINVQLAERILARFSEKNKFKVEDMAILGLFNTIIEKSNSIKILYDNEQYAGTDALLRSIYEASIYLQFLLEKYTRDRCMAYYLSLQLKEIEIAETIHSDKPLGNLIRKNIENAGYSAEIELLEEKEKISKIKEDYKKLTNANKSSKWMRVQKKCNNQKDRLGSFRDICEYLGDESLVEYEMYYRVLSNEVHPKDIKQYYSREVTELTLGKKKKSNLVEVMTQNIVIQSAKLVADYYNEKEFLKRRMQPVVALRKVNKK